METGIYLLKWGVWLGGFLLFTMIFAGIWGALYESSWGRRSNIRTGVAYGFITFLLAVWTGAVDALSTWAILGVGVSRFAMWATARHEEKERLAAEAVEARQRQEAAAEGERRQRLQALLEKQRQKKEAEEAARKKSELDAEKIRLRRERDAASALKALHSHLEVITSAVRSLQPGEGNAVLLNTIDGELKAIGRNAAITADMLADPEVREDAALVMEMLGDKGISDKILLNRLGKVFRIGAGA